MPELGALVHAAIEAADDGEQVEAYAEEGRQTEVSALRSQIEECGMGSGAPTSNVA